MTLIWKGKAIKTINLNAVDLHGSYEEYTYILEKLGYKSFGYKVQGQDRFWGYFAPNSLRGVLAYVGGNGDEIDFSTFEDGDMRSADIQKLVSSANVIAATFNGRVYDPQTEKYKQPKIKKSEKIKIMEWRLLK